MRINTKRRELLKLLGAGAAIGAMGPLAGCGGGDEVTESLADNLLYTTPANQAATYRHVDRIAATRVVSRGGSVLNLPAHATPLDALQYEFGGQTLSVADYMQRNRTSGLLVLQGGAVALERYGMGSDAASRWTTFSVAKSITSTLLGAAVADGSIASLDDRVTRYLPALNGTAYADNTIRELMRMCSGVRWDETYSATGDSDIARLSQALQANRPGSMLELMASRPRAAAPGSVFNYSTGESFVLGAVVAATIGGNLSDYLSEKIWRRAGMEADAYWLLEAEGGLEMGGDNLSATLRDYGRLGRFLMHGAEAVLPSGWMALAGHPDNLVTDYGQLYAGYPLGYGYQWWSFPRGAAALPYMEGAFTAEGIFGQFIYIDMQRDLVAVVLSAWPSSWVDAAEYETYAMLATVAANLA
jgi:CubicO group peptidase (beta-lactamase class C family)